MAEEFGKFRAEYITWYFGGMPSRMPNRTKPDKCERCGRQPPYDCVRVHRDSGWWLCGDCIVEIAHTKETR